MASFMKISGVVLMCVIASVASAEPGPAPLPPMNTCSLNPTIDDSHYCGTKDNQKYPFGDGCFAQKIVTSGCIDVTPPGQRAALCKWTTIYPGLRQFPISLLCAHQKDWCDKNHFTNCQQVEANCEVEIKTFRAECV